MDVRAPEFPESIAEGELAEWYKQEGDYVDRDEPLADVETEKTTLEVVAPRSGTLTSIVKQVGETVESNELIAVLEEGERPAQAEQAEVPASDDIDADDDSDEKVAPAARRLAAETGIELSEVKGSGPRGTITKDDVAAVINSRKSSKPVVEPEVEVPTQTPTAAEPEIDPAERVERRVPMTRLRATIASRLVEAQHTAAMLTTFNEVNMDPIMQMRRRYQDDFQAAHAGTRLGFMSFFVRASTEALKRFPLVNASIDGNDIVYHGYYDIGVAVSTERGLVVPVIRDADALGMAQIEDQIIDYGEKARDGKLALEDMQGGTFTISNGGVFGSLLSTPILNPPQTAILGMHKIEERPIVEDGEIVIRPMMYLALSYDHRLIDGQEAVRFLVAIKGMIEDPARILLEL